MNGIIANLIGNLMFGQNSLNYVPGPDLYFGLLDASMVEIPSVARVAYASNRFNWFDTSGGIDALSIGSKKFTANTSSIRFAQPTANYTPAYVGIYTAQTGGSLLFATQFQQSYTVLSTDSFGPQIYANDLIIAFYDYATSGVNAPAAGFSPYATSRFIDFLFRGNTNNFVFPTTYQLALMLDDRGNEVSTSGTGYNRLTLTTGAGGNIVYSSGNVSAASRLTFPSVVSNWGNVKGIRLYDTLGNIWYEFPLANPVRIETGDEAPYFLSGSIMLTI